MTHRLTLTIAAAGLAIGCGSERALPEKAPPVSSYTTATHQVKLGEAAVAVLGATVTPEFFRSAEALPLVGRLFNDGDYLSSSRPVVVLSHELWVGRFASAPSIIGREIEMDERQVEVVGVMPPAFNFPPDARLWTPKRPGSSP